MRNLVKTIQNTIFQQQLFGRGAKIVVGVSGGPDSVCLLDVLAKIAPKADLELIIAHVNYGLRGKDSEKDQEFVARLAEKYKLITYGLQPAIGKNSSENELRNIRYDFFEEVRKENNFDFIAVAHNADDQAETFLMRVIRGSGLQGLSGMKYKNNFIIRPLLGISRKEILEYLKKNNLSYRTDKTNSQNLFFRNKVRNNLIPYLEKNYNPTVRKTISDAVTSIADDYSFLEDYGQQLIGKHKELSVKNLLALHPALQRRVLLLYIRRQQGNLKDIESAHIEEALKALRSTKGKNQVVVFKGLKLVRKGDKVIISQL
jgi:tRNA(Ile)-lysidine synthase